MVDEKLIISIKHYKDMQEYARLGGYVMRQYARVRMSPKTKKLQSKLFHDVLVFFTHQICPGYSSDYF